MNNTSSENAMNAAQPARSYLRKLQGILLVGDTIALLIFAALGRGSHGEATWFAAPFEVVKTAAPFMLGWFLVAPLLGAYRPSHPPRMLLLYTLIAWVVACPLGLGLRALFLQRGIPLSFAMVTFITNLLLLTGWRSIFAWITSRRA
jgi:hypothetical protein